MGHCLKAEALPFPIPLCVLCEPPNLVSAQGYHSGDWGDLLLNDAKENHLSVRGRFRGSSSYAAGAERVWIIIKADRSSTCILLPNDD